MKKNTMMRIASLVLVLTLLSTCAISGTFAKYVTTGSGTDTARVAKWGVTVGVNGAMFADQYTTGDTANYTGSYSVEAFNKTDSAAGNKIVAPGTTADNVAAFSITGTPEVAVNVAVTLDKDGALQQITVPANTQGATYPDYTTSPNGTFTNDTDYNPIKWTLTKASEANGTYTTVSYTKTDDDTETTLNNVGLDEIDAYLSSISGNYDPNTDLTTTFGYYKLSWEWEYSDAAAVTNVDKLDTLLGEEAAKTTGQDQNIKLTEAFSLSITVTQID